LRGHFTYLSKLLSFSSSLHCDPFLKKHIVTSPYNIPSMNNSNAYAATVEDAEMDEAEEPIPSTEGRPPSPPPARPPTPENEQAQSSDGRVTIRVIDTRGGEVTFQLKQDTKLGKLMNVYCQRNGKDPNKTRFLYDGSSITAEDTPASVRLICCPVLLVESVTNSSQLEMVEGDGIEVYEEQVGGASINIIVRDGGGRGYELMFTVKPTTKLSKMMDAYCTKQKYFFGHPPQRLGRFFFEGNQIQDEDTPESVSLSFSVHVIQ
jgi:hypothetical protein